MRMVSSLLALSLLGADGGSGSTPTPTPAPAPTAPAPPRTESQATPAAITYQVNALDMDSLAWREMIYFRLEPAGRQRTATLWTTDRATVRAIRKKAKREVAAPKVTAHGKATINVPGAELDYVADMKRKANGPVHHASTVAFEPETARVREGLTAHIEGRSTDKGVRLHLSCTGEWLASLYTVKLPEVFVNEDGIESDIINAQIQVPEVVSCQLDGEWTVPTDRVLVVSLGVHASVDQRRAEEDESLDDAVRVRERLLLIEPTVAAQPVAAMVPAVASPIPLPNPRPMPVAAAVLPPLPEATQGEAERGAAVLRVFEDVPHRPETPTLPVPEVPSRSLPLAGGGSVEEPLPPLPELSVDDDALLTRFDPSAEPRPSPQAVRSVKFGPTGSDAKGCEAGADCAGSCPAELAVKPIKLDLTCPAPCTSKEDAKARHLTLAEAIRLGLEASETVRIVSLGAHGQPTIIAPAGEADREAACRLKSSVMQLVRSVEQQYWALSHQQVNLWAHEAAVDAAEQFLQRGMAAQQAGRCTAADVAQARLRVEQLRFELVTATADLGKTERRLRDMLHLPAADGRRLVAVSSPCAGTPGPDWDTCLAQMMTNQPDVVLSRMQAETAGLGPMAARGALVPVMRAAGLSPIALGLAVSGKTSPAAARQRDFYQQVIHQTTHSLARFFLEVDANGKQVETAGTLRAASEARLKELCGAADLKHFDLECSLDALCEWARAVAQEAQFKASYTVSMVALEEAKGTLLGFENLALDETSAPAPAMQATAWRRIGTIPVDPAMIRTRFQPEDAAPCCEGTDKGERALAPTPTGTLRIPLGGKLAVEVRARVEPKKPVR